MNLKRGLEGQISAELAEFKLGANEAKKALRALGKEDLNDADYDIELRALWAAEGEKSVTIEYHGSLKDAIKEAEERFKEMNRRDCVQANCSVFIRLAGIRYEIPPKYWKKFEEK
jgi:hypothetical protein